MSPATLVCADVRPLISQAFDGGTLDLSIDEHLATCDACTAYADQLTAMRRHLRFSAVETPPDIAGAVMESITATPTRFGRRRRALTAAAVVIAIGAAGIGLGGSNGDPEPAADRASSIVVAWSDAVLPGDATGRVQALAPVIGATKADLANARLLSLTSPSGSPYQLQNSLLGVEILGFDPATYPAFASAPSRTDLTDLGPSEAVVSSRTADRLALGPGSTLTFEGDVELQVRAVVPGADIGAAEIAVTQATARSLAAPSGEYLVVEHTGDNESIAAEIGAEFESDAVRFRSSGDADYLRGGDDPTPQVDRKERFGQYTLIPIDEDRLVPDPAWQAEYLAEANVPLLGAMQCHRDVLVALTAAMDELRTTEQANVLDPTRTSRCWVPAVRRDADPIDFNRIWGIAVELNYDPVQEISSSTSALRDVMARFGFDFLGDDTAGVFVFRGTDPEPPAEATEPPKVKQSGD